MTDTNEIHVVFGASGPLGGAVVRELAAQGKRVRAVNRSGNATVPEGVEVVSGDATNPESTRRVCQGAAVVYHCMGAPYADWPTLFPPLMDGLIEGAAAAGAKLIFGDNLYLYGPVDGPLTEDLPHHATGPKGRTRAEVATTLLEAHQSGKVRAAIGRASDFYGPGVLLSTLGERVFRPVLAGKPASILGNLDAPHTYTFIDDFARALLTLGERDEALGRAWHVPNTETLTTRQFLEQVFEEAGRPPKIRAAPGWMESVLGLFNPLIRELKETRYQRDQPFVVDHSAFDRAFGSRPTPLRDAIRQTLDWYRQHPG